MGRIVVVLLCMMLLLGTAPVRAQGDAPADAPTTPPGVPRGNPSPQAGQAIERPAPNEIVVRDDMRTSSLFWPRSCTTGNNVGSHEADGLRLSITGRCDGTSTSAIADAFQPDVLVGDGEARVEFRVERGWERALISVLLVDTAPGAPGLAARVFPAARAASLVALTSEGSKVLTTGRTGDAMLRPDTWISLAVQRVGDRAWVILNDVPILVADGAPSNMGAVIPTVSRSGSVDDSDEVVVTFREFTASHVQGGDGGRGVTRAPRPVVDPRFERILAFIRTDLVEDPGTDEAAAERRAIGRSILGMIDATNVNLEVALLPDTSAARFSPFLRAIRVDERLMTFTPHVATMLLMHEIVHANQERVGYVRGCYERELDATKWETRLWRAWFGPNGKVPPGDAIEASFTSRVLLERDGRLDEAIRAVYQEQCSRM